MEVHTNTSTHVFKDEHTENWGVGGGGRESQPTEEEENMNRGYLNRLNLLSHHHIAVIINRSVKDLTVLNGSSGTRLDGNNSSVV